MVLFSYSLSPFNQSRRTQMEPPAAFEDDTLFKHVH